MKFDGSAVRQERLALGVPLDTLATLAGTSNCWLSKVERGIIPEPSEFLVCRLSAALAVLQVLAQQVEPLRLDFSQVAGLRALLAKMEASTEPSKRPRSVAGGDDAVATAVATE